MALGPTMIAMYVDMVKDEFKSLLEILDSRNDRVRPIVRDVVSEECGLTELQAKRAKLRVQIDRIDDEISYFTQKRYDKPHNGLSRLDCLVAKRMREIDGVDKEVRNTMKTAIKEVKMLSVPDGARSIFDNLSERIAALTEQVEQLPDMTSKEKVLALAQADMKK